MPENGGIWRKQFWIQRQKFFEIAVNEKDLFSFAAQKQSGAQESSGRKVKRSLGERNRR
jgi:hypothetical protein